VSLVAVAAHVSQRSGLGSECAQGEAFADVPVNPRARLLREPDEAAGHLALPIERRLCSCAFACVRVRVRVRLTWWAWCELHLRRQRVTRGRRTNGLMVIVLDVDVGHDEVDRPRVVGTHVERLGQRWDLEERTSTCR
jgi:hypothetical protein